MIGLSMYAVFAIITGAVKVRCLYASTLALKLGADPQNRLSMCVTRALSGLGLSIASPAGFGIIGVNIRHEPARTIVFAAFGQSPHHHLRPQLTFRLRQPRRGSIRQPHRRGHGQHRTVSPLTRRICSQLMYQGWLVLPLLPSGRLGHRLARHRLLCRPSRPAFSRRKG